MEFFEAAFATIFGYKLYRLITHPKKLKSKMPKISIGPIKITPNFQIKFKNRTIWIHHWIWMSAALALLNHLAKGMENLLLVKFFTVGGIIQGFTFADRFHIYHAPEKPLTRLPYISVVVPAYNEEKNIRKNLMSIKKQDYPGKVEIILADNNSTDKTAQIAKKMGVKVIFESQKGVAYTRQAGFMEAQGEIIATTDADTIVPKNWLSWYARKFEEQKNAVMLSGMFTFYDGSRGLNFWNWLLNYPQFRLFGWYSGANMAVKRDAFLKIGGFNTSLPLSEDSDLGVRLRKLGKVLRYANFKVETSARRFNQLGFWAAVWDYCYNYVKYKALTIVGKNTENVSFRSGSEVANLGLLPKLAIQTAVIVIVLAGFLGGIFEIKPVKAAVVRRGHYVRNHLPKHMTLPDIDMPSMPHFHHTK